MEWKEELAKLGLGKIATGLLLLAGFLILVVWRETLYGKWAQVAEGLSKPALMALLGLAVLLALITVCLLAAYIIYLLRTIKRLQQPAPVVKHRRMLGVFWDEENNPLCPVCEILLHMFYINPDSDNETQALRCPKCKAEYTLLDDEGYQHKLFEVKAYLNGTNPREFD